MFKQLGEKTLYIFAACNALTIPMIWALYPETAQRTLEEVDMLFASDSIWVWKAEKNFNRMQEQGIVPGRKSSIQDVLRRRSSTAVGSETVNGYHDKELTTEVEQKA
jgi:hypothetical protein